MSEMIERASRAMNDLAAKLGYAGHADDPELRLFARAAIEAMREPTEAMVSVVLDDEDITGIVGIWECMIDEALK